MTTRLSFSQKTPIYEKLKEVCFKTGEGICKFAENWDDRRVAELLKVPEGSVRSVRREMFGHTRKNGSVGKLLLEERITAIEEYLTSKNPNWKT